MTTKSNLLHAVQTVYRSSQAKTSLPILGSILFRVQAGELSTTSTDIDLTLQCKVSVEAVQEGAICLPARQIMDIVRSLPDAAVQLESDETTNSVKILYNDSQMNIKGYPPDQFPALPEVIEQISFELAQGLLKEMIRQTIYAVSTDRTRPLFTGVLFENEDQRFRLVATDTHRLALRETGVDADRFGNVIVPGGALSELVRIMRGEDEPVQIKISKSHISFAIQDALLISRLIAGQFPAYRQIIPHNFSARLTMNALELSNALARAALLIEEEIPILRFNLEEGRSLISVNTPSGWIKENLKADYTGDPMEIYFNARYLMETLRPIPTEEVTINFTSPLSAAIIQPAGKDDYLALLLPARPKSD
ncbi:MAG: DNA polymerase III subunit beta [Armatimonadetes bacterium]|nr:DNA polymerase III subunit beta [Armatimonadota bacterium]